MYRERRSRVPGAVVWTTVADGAESRVLPDGCMDLLWMRDELVVAGPDTRAQLTRLGAGERVTGVRLAPGTAPTLLGVPAHALRDARVALDALWRPADVARLTDEVATADHPGLALEALAGRALVRVGGPRAETAAVVAMVRDGRSVADIAAVHGVGERRLHREAQAAFGYGLRTLGRVLRLQRAVTLVHRGLALADVAAAAGYADQPHLSREVRALAGVSPSQLRM
ncbi:helix-turn-helix domain-containing protein [Cellulomonas hominis]